MLPKGSRLSKHQVEYVLQNGSRVSSKYFFATVLSSGPAITLSKPRFAAVVSKKVAVTAVERNNLRRRTYNAIRGALEKVGNLKKPCAMVIVVKKGIQDVRYEDLMFDVGVLLRPFV